MDVWVFGHSDNLSLKTKDGVCRFHVGFYDWFTSFFKTGKFGITKQGNIGVTLRSLGSSFENSQALYACKSKCSNSYLKRIKLNSILSSTVESTLEHGMLAKRRVTTCTKICTNGKNLGPNIIIVYIYFEIIRKMHVHANSTRILSRLCPQGSNGMSEMRLMNNYQNFYHLA